MNSSKQIFFVVAAILLGLPSCETTIDFKGNIPESKPVVYCNAEAGQPLEVKISRSVFFQDFPDDSKSYYKDLDEKIKTVSATIDGKTEELTRSYSPVLNQPEYWSWDSCYFVYNSVSKPVAGSKIDLKVKIAGFDTVEAETKVPNSPEFRILEAIPEEEGSYEDLYYYGNVSFTLWMKDEPNTDNWYQLVVWRTDSDGYSSENYFLSSDILFRQTTDIYEAIDTEASEEQSYYGAVFQDNIIDGKSHTFKIKVNYYYDEEEGPREPFKYTVCLRSISQSLYYYLSSLATIDNMSGLGTFGEYATLYSNVSGGIGCLSSWASTSCSFEF